MVAVSQTLWQKLLARLREQRGHRTPVMWSRFMRHDDQIIHVARKLHHSPTLSIAYYRLQNRSGVQ
jgi:hypothetical protein